MSWPVVAVLGVCASLAATPLAMALARRTGMVDRPGALKVHAEPIPYLGGLGVACGVVAGSLAGVRLVSLVPLLGALLLGVLDDARPQPPLARIVGEVAIGAAVGYLGSPGHPGDVALGVALTLGTINAWNLVDGLDGLAGGVTVVAAAGFSAVLPGSGRALAAALGGAAAGFLLYNRPPARIFLGDGGSYLLGTGMAVLALHALTRQRPIALGIASLAFLGYPAAEAAFSIVRRARRGQRISEGDRDHAYDRLVACGLSAPASVASCVLVEAVLVALGILARGWGVTGSLGALAGAAATMLVGGALLGALG